MYSLLPVTEKRDEHVRFALQRDRNYNVVGQLRGGVSTAEDHAMDSALAMQMGMSTNGMTDDPFEELEARNKTLEDDNERLEAEVFRLRNELRAAARDVVRAERLVADADVRASNATAAAASAERRARTAERLSAAEQRRRAAEPRAGGSPPVPPQNLEDRFAD